MRIPKGALACAIVIASSLASGCSEETPQCPSYQVGAIEGFVRGGGTPVPGTQIRAIPFRTYDDTRFRVDDDSTGAYRMDLPSGTYMLSLYGPGESRGGSRIGRLPDTVRVGTSVQRYDLNKGRLEATVNVPAFMEGRSIDCGGKTATAENGSLDYTFPLVEPGVFELSLRLGIMDLWLPGKIDRSQADRIAVGSATPTTYAADLSGMSEITGAVHGSWQTMRAVPPYMMAFGADSVLVAMAASSSSDGSFTLDVFPAQPVRIAAGSKSRHPQLWIGGNSYDTATLYDLQPGAQIAGMEIVESGILCHLDWADPSAVYDADIRLIDPWNREIDPFGWVSDDNIAITTLAPGRYFLQVRHSCDQTWAPVWYGGSETLYGATPIDIGDWGQTAKITVGLHPGGRIHGSIQSASGGSPGYVRALLYDSEGVALCDAYGDNTTGAFDFPGLDNGDYRLAADVGSGWWYPGTADADSARVITIADHDSLSGIDWRLPQ